MFGNVNNFKQQGNIGMAYDIAYYTKLGYVVSIPLTDSQDYDLIIDTGIKLLKVQVKTTDFKTKHGIYQVGLKTCGGNKSNSTVKKFNQNSSDLLFVLTSDGTCYSIPRSSISTTCTINLGDTYIKYKVML